MPNYTTNYNLIKPLGIENYDIANDNSNMDTIDGQMKKYANSTIYETAGGTGTTITLSNVTLENGCSKTFIASANNGGAATTINGKALYKPGTTTAPILIKDKAYTVWYNVAGTCFFIKASATGTASVGDVLAGVTFSNDNDTDLIGTLTLTGSAGDLNVLSGQTYYNADAKTKRTGTMANNTTDQNSIVNSYLGTVLYMTPPVGYWNGSARVMWGDANFTAANIKKDTSIFGLIGTYDPITLVVGETLLYSEDTTSNILQNYYYKIKAAQINNKGGTVRVRFDLKESTSSYTVYGKIYVNGVARGIEHSTTSTTAVTFTEDITINAGDTIQIYANTNGENNGSGMVAYVSNFRIYVGNVFPSIIPV